jgi:hypothetical protein
MHLRTGERAIHCEHGAPPVILVRCNGLLEGMFFLRYSLDDV